MRESKASFDDFVLDLQLMRTTWEMLVICKCIVPEGLLYRKQVTLLLKSFTLFLIFPKSCMTRLLD